MLDQFSGLTNIPVAGLQDQTDMSDWVKVTLGQKAAKVKTTSKLENHPCVVTVEEMAAARHFIKTQGANFSEEQR